jgi:hypothetical protein
MSFAPYLDPAPSPLPSLRLPTLAGIDRRRAELLAWRAGETPGPSMTDKKPHPYNEAGRRLKAALISYQLGRAGVDYTLKQVPEDVGDDWAELAGSLLQGMLGGRSFPRAVSQLV